VSVKSDAFLFLILTSQIKIYYERASWRIAFLRTIQDFFKLQKIKKVKRYFFLTVAIFLMITDSVNDFSVQALTVATTIIRPNSVNQPSCPTDLQALLDKMLPDLPSYTNRVIQRASTNRQLERDIYILLATQLDELEALPFNVNLDHPDETYLVYFQTWQRKHYPQKIIRFKQYHWLFLRISPTGWVLEKMFSKSSSYPQYGFYPLPGETSESAIAQAIRLWLRDCQAANSN
jgi:hypothetical protein